MKVQGSVETGRHLPRTAHYECHTCHIRNAIGTPKVMDTWPARLHAVPLTLEQWELLLTAAAEMREHCEACANCVCEGPRKPHEHRCPDCGCRHYERVSDEATPVEFLDWVRPDALGIAHAQFMRQGLA